MNTPFILVLYLIIAITATNTVFNISETEDATNSLDGSGERSIGLPLSHNIGIELYFIFDASSTVGVANFESSKKFAKRLVREVSKIVYSVRICFAVEDEKKKEMIHLTSDK